MKKIYKVWTEDFGIYTSWGIYFNEDDAEKAFNFAKKNKKYSRSTESVYIAEQDVCESFEEFKSNYEGGN